MVDAENRESLSLFRSMFLQRSSLGVNEMEILPTLHIQFDKFTTICDVVLLK